MASHQQHCKELKAQLKQWEADFNKSHGRLPIKADIDQNPEMVQLYKAYRDASKPKPSIIKQSQLQKLQKKSTKSDTVKNITGQLTNKSEELPETPGAKKRPVLEQFIQSPTILYKKAKNVEATLLEQDFNFVTDDQIDTNLLVNEVHQTAQVAEYSKAVLFKPQAQHGHVNENQFQSPVARPTLGLSQRAQIRALPRLQNILQSPASRNQQNIEQPEVIGENDFDDSELAALDLTAFIEQPPAFDDDEPFRAEPLPQEKKKWVKRPIMGKRQTSKRKLEPVYRSTEVTGIEQKKKQAPKKKQQRANDGSSGIRIKMGKKKFQSVDFSKADRIAVKGTYKKSTELFEGIPE